jgi:hypothetical protein
MPERERGADAAGIVIDEDVERSIDEKGRAARERRSRAAGEGEPVADERSELGREERTALLLREWAQVFAALRRP